MKPRTLRERRLIRKAQMILEDAMGDEVYDKDGKVPGGVAGPSVGTVNVTGFQGGQADRSEGIYANEGSLRGQGGGAAGQKMAMQVVRTVITGGDQLVLRNAPAGASGTPDIAIPLWRPFTMVDGKPVYDADPYFIKQMKGLKGYTTDRQVHDEITRGLNANRAVFDITTPLNQDLNRDGAKGVGRYHKGDFSRFGDFCGFTIEVKDAGSNKTATIDPGKGNTIWTSVQHEDGFIFMRNKGGDKSIKFAVFEKKLSDKIPTGGPIDVQRAIGAKKKRAWSDALGKGQRAPDTGRAQVDISFEDAGGTVSSYEGANLDSLGPAVVTYYEILQGDGQTPFISRIVGGDKNAIKEWRRVGSHFDRHGHTALPIFYSSQETNKVYPWLPNITKEKSDEYIKKRDTFYDTKAIGYFKHVSSMVKSIGKGRNLRSPSIISCLLDQIQNSSRRERVHDCRCCPTVPLLA